MSILAIVSAVTSALPVVSKWLGFDEGKANKVVDIVQKVTGINEPEKALDRLRSDPDTQLQVIQILRQSDKEFFQLELEDLNKARAMQQENLKNNKSRIAREFIYWYAGSVTLLTFIYLFCITFIQIPTSAENYANTILGFLLGTAFGGLVNFFFGSSKPVNKDE